jgi:hypothetical protein
MDKPTVSIEDINRVKDYMMNYHQGFVKARPRQVIAQTLGIEDRHFRAICAEIPEIITSHRFGYYILPLVDLTGIETRRARDILDGEDRRRMISLYLRMRRQRQAIKKMQAAERQMELAI